MATDYEQALANYRAAVEKMTIGRIPILPLGDGMIFVTGRSIWLARRRRKRRTYAQRYIRQSKGGR